MKWPTMDEFAQMVADKAIDEVEYNGKTLRQWIEIILATDKNVGTKLGTNLAEVGTDMISRQSAISALDDEITIIGKTNAIVVKNYVQRVKRRLEQLPSTQPETAKRIVGKSRNGMTLWYQCNVCNEPVDEKDAYCRGCGRRLIDG